MENKAMRRGEMAAGTILLLLALFAIQQAIVLQLWAYGGPGPGFFPFILGALLAPMAAFYLGSAVLHRNRDRHAAHASGDAMFPLPATESAMGATSEFAMDKETTTVLWGKVGAYILCLAGFAFGMTLFGVWLTMAVVIFILLAGIERFGPVRSLLFTALFTAGSYLLFERLLAVPLPHGTIW